MYVKLNVRIQDVDCAEEKVRAIEMGGCRERELDLMRDKE